MGRAVARVSQRVGSVTRKFTAEIMPIGPEAVSMSPAELRKTLGSMSGEERLALSNVIGEEAMLEMMRVAAETQ